MNKNIRDLLPNTVWDHFSNLNAVPRASKKEEKVVAENKLTQIILDK